MSPQHPLPSGFGAKTTTREVIGERRLDGTTAIVTGGYAGIGLETTRVLAATGADVIVPARDIAKATAALSGLANVSIDELDLAVPVTIDAFAARFGDRPLHLLVNNAGIMAAPLYGRGASTGCRDPIRRARLTPWRHGRLRSRLPSPADGSSEEGGVRSARAEGAAGAGGT
jgi:hypothetical protein